MSNQPILTCDQLNFVWQQQSGLHQVQLQLNRQQRLGIIGPNGAGKSTLLKLLAGLLRPHSGEILLDGQPLADYSLVQRARKLALLTQETELCSASSVYELVELGLLPHKKLWQRTDPSDRNRILQVLSQVGLAEKAAAQVSRLSGGELQRAHFARVLLQGSELLLLDEPTNHLDIKYQHQLLQNICHAKLSLVATFHDLNLAASYCDQLVLLQMGKVVAAGTVEQVLQPKLIQAVFGRNCLVDLNPFDGKPRVTFAPGALDD